MAIADALSLSYIMLNVMCQVLSLVMLGRTSTDIGRHTELTYFRWLLITFVLYCVADSVPVLSQVGFITPQARLFALELSIVLISFMAYLWYKFAEAHLLPTERPSKVVGMLEAVPFVLLIAAFILCIPTDYLAYVRGGSVWRGRYYSFLMIPSIPYLAAMSIRAFAMASRERVRSRVVDELLIVQFSAAPTIGAVVDELGGLSLDHDDFLRPAALAHLHRCAHGPQQPPPSARVLRPDSAGYGAGKGALRFLPVRCGPFQARE